VSTRRRAIAVMVVRALVLAIALAMGIDGLLYAILGIRGAIATIGRLFALTYPIVDGRAAMPMLGWAPAVFSTHRVATYVHVLLTPIALILGPLQLWSDLRTRRPELHRLLGRLYVVAVLVGVPAGVYLGLYEGEGVVATMGFLGMGLTTVTCTALAWHAARSSDFTSHRAFMVRSYTVLFSGNVLVRLSVLLLLPRLAPMPAGFHDPYVICVYLTWSLGLLGADVYLYLARRKPQQRSSGA
jgi:uncharacterized membrane protein